ERARARLRGLDAAIEGAVDPLGPAHAVVDVDVGVGDGPAVLLGERLRRLDLPRDGFRLVAAMLLLRLPRVDRRSHRRPRRVVGAGSGSRVTRRISLPIAARMGPWPASHRHTVLPDTPRVFASAA